MKVKTFNCTCGGETLHVLHENGVVLLETADDRSWWERFWMRGAKQVVLDKEAVADLVDFLIEAQNE